MEETFMSGVRKLFFLMQNEAGAETEMGEENQFVVAHDPVLLGEPTVVQAPVPVHREFPHSRMEQAHPIVRYSLETTADNHHVIGEWECFVEPDPPAGYSVEPIYHSADAELHEILTYIDHDPVVDVGLHEMATKIEHELPEQNSFYSSYYSLFQ